jgi:hypothetical protein
MHAEDKKKKRKKEKIKDVFLEFCLCLLICADAHETIKHEYRGLYSSFMVHVFTDTARDALIMRPLHQQIKERIKHA